MSRALLARRAYIRKEMPSPLVRKIASFQQRRIAIPIPARAQLSTEMRALLSKEGTTPDRYSPRRREIVRLMELSVSMVERLWRRARLVLAEDITRRLAD
jgi:hypothetical protein